MSEHAAKIVRHGYINCHTSRVWQPANGDCGTRFEARCSCGFMQGAICREHADAIARGHRADPGAQVVTWDHPDNQPDDEEKENA